MSCADSKRDKKLLEEHFEALPDDEDEEGQEDQDSEQPSSSDDDLDLKPSTSGRELKDRPTPISGPNKQHKGEASKHATLAPARVHC